MKEKLKKCSNDNCKNEARKHRTECPKCSYIRLRDKDPIRHAYLALRRNAKRRNKEFSITLEQFTKFCNKTDYMLGRGTSKEGYHIDRIDETKGYHIDNIQILTNTENTKKYVSWFWNGKNMEFKTRTVKEEEINSKGDCPF